MGPFEPCGREAGPGPTPPGASGGGRSRHLVHFEVTSQAALGMVDGPTGVGTPDQGMGGRGGAASLDCSWILVGFG